MRKCFPVLLFAIMIHRKEGYDFMKPKLIAQFELYISIMKLYRRNDNREIAKSEIRMRCNQFIISI